MEPAPLISLAYQRPGDDVGGAVDRITRGVGWFVMLRAGIRLASYAWVNACSVWQHATANPAYRQVVPAYAPWIVIPNAAVLAVLLLASGGCVRRREAGRRWVVRAAAVDAVLSFLESVGQAIYYSVTYHYARYGTAYAVYQFGHSVLYASHDAMLSIATVLFFRHPAVRHAFRTR